MRFARILVLTFLTISTSLASTPSPLLIAGDEAFQHRSDEVQARAALDLYRKRVAETEKKESDSLWRVSMGCYFVGLRFVHDKDEQIKIFAEGRDAGLLSAELDHQCASCRFWAAINMALYGQTVGVVKMLFSLKQIRELLKESKALDPSYAHAGAQRLLGLIYQKVPGILGGSNSRAKDYFEEAISTAPDEPLNYLFLARLYREDLGDKPAALQAIQKGLDTQKIAVATPDRLESIEALADLKKMESDLYH
jgi:tetratricopeptide (TPR) repeat protein